MKKEKTTKVEKLRNEYYKKISVLNEKLIGTKWKEILDINNAELSIACKYGISANVRIPYKRELSCDESVELEAFICDLSKENKLLLYCVDFYEEEIVLENPTIKKKIQKYFIDKLLVNYFGDISDVKETIPLVENENLTSFNLKKLVKWIDFNNHNPFSGVEYKIVNDKLIEINNKTKAESQLFDIGDLVTIKESEHNKYDMFITLKNEDEGFYLTEDGFTY